MKGNILGSLFVILLLLCIGCAGTAALTTNTPTTISPANRSPSVEELRAGNFSHPEIPRITAQQLKLMLDGVEGWE